MTIYGLNWNLTTDICTPTDALVGTTTPAQRTAICDTAAPWQLKRCNLSDDGTPTAYHGDRCYTDTDTYAMGPAMVEIPKFYYKTTYTAPTFSFKISDVPASGYVIHPAFTRGGATRDYIYLGAYEASAVYPDKLESKAGVEPAVRWTVEEFRTAAELRAGSVQNEWEIQDYLITCAVQYLYLVEYGHFNSQTVLSNGITNSTSPSYVEGASLTGHTSSLQVGSGSTDLGNASGEVLHTFDVVPESGDLTGYAMSYRGIENFYGNTWTMIDGINIEADYKPYVADHNFVSDTFTGSYSRIGASLVFPSNGGYISDLWVPTNTYGFFPAVAEGSGSTYLCDYYWSDVGNQCVAIGGCWDHDYEAWAGMFACSLQPAAFYHYFYGTRLMYIGT